MLRLQHRHDMFKDRRLRQALGYAFDFEWKQQDLVLWANTSAQELSSTIRNWQRPACLPPMS